jgi:hypothetical protein
MKCVYFFFMVLLGPVLGAADAPPAELPEPSLPPYSVGALPLESGLMIERPERPDLNLRFVENKMRVYWIDEDGLVAEPDASLVTVRFYRVTRGRDYHRLARLGDEAGFGTSYIVPKPHIYSGALTLNSDDREEPEVHAFRYTAEMDAVAEPSAQ